MDTSVLLTPRKTVKIYFGYAFILKGVANVQCLKNRESYYWFTKVFAGKLLFSFPVLLHTLLGFKKIS